jgi:DNA-binding NtrC family response regulator
MKILLVEDERTLAIPLADSLREAGHDTTMLHDGAAALAWLAEHSCDLVVTDVRLPGSDGIEVLRRARSFDPPLPVLIMTGYATIEQAVEAMRLGAFGYLQKPFPSGALLAQVAQVAELQTMRAELRELRSGGEASTLTGASSAIRSLNERVVTVAQQDVGVLIRGESGTGKERVARAVHLLSEHAEGPFVAVSCSAIPAQLLEGELFGFLRGAFTGADRDRVGLVEEAAGGTLFLDDIDDVPLEAQAKLLRLLQEREFTPLGAPHTRDFEARVVAATKVDLREAVAEGRFREDLYFRLDVVPLEVPPLRERREDIPALLGSFLRSRDPDRRYRIPDEVLGKLALHPWPGNVRELENALVRALALAGRARVLRLEHFLPGGLGAHAAVSGIEVLHLREVTRRAETEAIRAALAETEGRKLKAAELLGVSRKVLWQKMKELGMDA